MYTLCVCGGSGGEGGGGVYDGLWRDFNEVRRGRVCEPV